MNRPVFGGISLLVSFSAVTSLLIGFSLPSGVGEQGFARYVVYRFTATATAALLIGVWSGLAAASLYRREGAGRLLLLGLSLTIPAVGWCIYWWRFR